MFRSFWFYFYSLPLLFSLIVFTTPLTYYYPLSVPIFSDALEFCHDVINDDIYATEYGTMQDQCVDNYMGEPKIVEPLIFLFGIIGGFFIFPFLFFLFFSWKRASYINKP